PSSPWFPSRYPIDPYDRKWKPWNNVPYWTEISTASTIQSRSKDNFEVPSSVLQTAVTPVNSSKLLFYWIPHPEDKDPVYVAALHFSELINALVLKEFNVYLNDILCNSVLPPILNAVEIFRLSYITGTATDGGDVSAIVAIKAKYKVIKDWSGDPCAPQDYAWEGLNCIDDTSNTPRITTLNLSSSGLTGDITTSFANLKALQNLDLSHNSLTGSIPDELSNLPSLKLLDLTGNQISGPIPVDLLKRSQDGSLTLRIEDNKDLCANGNSCELPPKKKNPMVLIIVIVAIVILVLLVMILLLHIMRKWQDTATEAPHIDNPPIGGSSNAVGSFQFENQRFKYKELAAITDNFRREIGRGGFGEVYHGFLENGTQVAVKMRSNLSRQGLQEFLITVKHLMQVHHNNLVSMIGYCKDGDYLGVVYEYMSEGTLQDHLIGGASSDITLSWRQRLRIAIESAQGLKYLHNELKPPLIHGNMKTRSILLSENLLAKIADFGLSMGFHARIGTQGYIDPEYLASYENLSEKSDVYSFGVVLLEMITGKPPILLEPEVVHITNWVRHELNRGLIENIIDPRMQGEYNVNSVWKVAELALDCTAQTSNQRPTMTEIFLKLKEYFDLESIGERSHNIYSGGSNQCLRSDILYSVPLRSVSTTDGPQIR
ncbi:senescence-induced receptor-like serine/threonine-protein kinase, partial [Typha latifolia]|uniref:senescence-induced receptor-like serine/threonine-protein kinase n=1 Tax=Typha latifolia TaxID=4733 RepID=UPI003C2B4472